MSEVRACSVCGSGNAATSERCWVCGASLAAAGPTAQVPRSVTDSGDALQALGWLGLLSGIGFVTLLIAIELWVEWPGLLIPYAVIVVIGFAALTRTAWLQTRRKDVAPTAPAAAAQPQAPAAPARPGQRSLAHDVALGVSIALMVIAGLALLMIAAVVIFFIICLAVIGGSGGFH